MLSPRPKKSDGELVRTLKLLLVASKILLSDAYDILCLAFSGVILSLLIYNKREAMRGRVYSSSLSRASWFALRSLRMLELVHLIRSMFVVVLDLLEPYLKLLCVIVLALNFS